MDNILKHFKMNIKLFMPSMKLITPLLLSVIFLAGFNSWLSFLIQMLTETIFLGISYSFLNISIILILSCILFIAMQYIFIITSEMIHQHIEKKIKENMMLNLMGGNNDAEDKSTGNILNNYMKDAEVQAGFFTKAIIPLLRTLLNIILGLIYVTAFSKEIGFLVFMLSLIILVANIFISKKMRGDYLNWQNFEDDKKTFFIEIFNNMPVVKVFTMLPSLSAKKDAMTKKIMSHSEAYYKKHSILTVISQNGEYIILLIIIIYGLYLVNGKILTIGALIGIWNACSGSIIYPISMLPDLFGNLANALGSRQRLDGLIGCVEVNSDKVFEADYLSRSIESENPFIKIEANNVYFKYELNSPLLEDVSFKYCTGDFIYITGKSGCGKSTLIKLIMQMLKPDKGEICLYINEQKIENKSISKYISYVAQEHVIFNLSVIDNICLGLDVAKDKVYELCMKLDIHEDIENLDNGYDTMLNEDINLSVGQIQRLSIARALLLNRPIIIFDEPFSSLDANNRNIALESIKPLIEQKICFIVTHDVDLVDYDKHCVISLCKEME